MHQSSMSPTGAGKTTHKAALLESEANLSQVRYKHHESRRKSKSLIANDGNFNNFPPVALVNRLYDFLCVMSTIPTLNPSLAMNNANSKSKTTINSGGGGLGALTQKSHRGRLSPFRADKILFNNEMTRMSKDETRQNFSCLVGNLPNISKKPRRKAQPFTVANKKVKRKASIPPPPKNLRLAQSQGASIIKVDTDSIHEGA